MYLIIMKKQIFIVIIFKKHLYNVLFTQKKICISSAMLTNVYVTQRLRILYRKNYNTYMLFAVFIDLLF